jgi:GTP-binding protein
VFEAEPFTAEELTESQEDRQKFNIEVEDGVYYVDAPFLEPIMRTVNMDDYSSLQYFQRVLRSSGIIDTLEKMGIKENDTVDIFGFQFDFIY